MLRRLITSLVATAGITQAIIVAPGSPCETSCGNVLSSTSSDDVICLQENYSPKGNDVFQTCVECELHSGYHDVAETGQTETDAQWVLYNLRYSLSYCLFGLPENDNIISPVCATSEACGMFQEGIQFKNLTTSNDVGEFDYCALWPVSDAKHVINCRKCLQAGGHDYMANFFTVLQAGCEQQPVPGVTVAVDGSPFTPEQINVTDPTPQATIDPAWFDNGPINLGVKVGIAAAALVVILAILGFCIVWRGRRKRKAFLRSYDASKQERKGWPSPIQTTMSNSNNSNIMMREHNTISNTPLSQRPLRSWDESPMSAATDQQFPRYFSPYSSQFNSPISATDVKQFQWPVLSAAGQEGSSSSSPPPPGQEIAGRSIGLSLGGKTPDFASGSMGKQQQGQHEEYEMYNVDVRDSVGAGLGVRDVSEQQQQQDQEGDFKLGHGRSYGGSYRNFGSGSQGH